MPAGADLADLTWPEVAGRARASVLVVPVGSTEQHGPHLPLSTDTDVAVALATRLADARAEVVVAPAVAYGSSGEHAAFSGTLSIGLDALELLLVELGRGADDFAGVLFLSAHGGNSVAVAKAVARLGEEGRRVLAWSPGGAVDAHAGFTETSVMLALAPARVHLDRAQPGAPEPIAELMDRLRRSGVVGVAANGVLGDPTGASAAAGAAILNAWATDLVSALDSWS